MTEAEAPICATKRSIGESAYLLIPHAVFRALRVVASTSGSGLHEPYDSKEAARLTARMSVSSTRKFALSMPREIAAATRAAP